jgi:hypothetical protein
MNMRRTLGQIQVDAGRAMTATVTAVALAGEKQAKINASTGAHRKGTPTPATRGVTGPSKVSGNLVRNITHEPVRQVGTLIETRVGVASGAEYGKWVEALGYEFMAPTARFLRTVVIPIAEASFRATFRA